MSRRPDPTPNEARGLLTALFGLHAAAFFFGFQQVEKLTRDLTSTVDVGVREARDLALRLAQAIEDGLDDGRRKTLARIGDFCQREGDRIGGALHLEDLRLESLQRRFDETVHAVAERLDELSRKRREDARERSFQEAKTQRAPRSVP